jgi:hypothetical protein
MRTPAVLGFICFLALGAAFPQDVVPPAPAPGGAASPTAAPAAGTAPAAAATAAVTAPATGKPDLSVPKDTSTQWQVGITVFSTVGLSPDNSYLAYSLPLLLKNQVSGLVVHTYQQEERDHAATAVISREIAAAEKAVTDARKDRDALLFNQVPVGAAARTPVEARLTAVLARLDFLRSLQPNLVEAAVEKPVTFKEGTGAGALLEAPAVPPEIYCAQSGIDLLIGGSIQEVQGYLLVDIWVFDRLAGTNVFSYRNASTREELYASLPIFGREIARTILGRPWSLVSFVPDPPDASLYLDGKLAASGASPTLYLAPGPHVIRLSATGYHDVTRSLELEPEKETRIDDRLEKAATGAIAISSDPPGADLYVDSLWKGKTPLAVDRPPLRSRGVLSSPGFYDISFSLGPASPEAFSFSLEKDVGTKDTHLAAVRDEFYGSLALFAFSVPLPLFSYAFAFDFALKSNYLAQSTPAAAAQAQSVSLVLQGTYYAGIAVSAALFVWMVTRIVNYVRVANEIAG